MTTIPELTDLMAQVRTLNVLDVVIVVFLLLYALDGIRRGFIAGALGLAGIFGTIVVALRFFTEAATLLNQFISMPSMVANVVGFFMVLALGQLVVAVVIRLVIAVVAPIKKVLVPLNVLDHLLGVVPGVIQAVIIVALILTPLRLFQVFGPISSSLERSVVAQLIARQTAEFTPQLQLLLGHVIEDSALSRTQVVQPDETIQIPARQNLRVDEHAEARMLQLLNEERVRAGVPAVVLDEQLHDMAQDHSEEMFRLGYFAHASPVSGNVVARMGQRNIRYDVVGENLAFGPTPEVAHEGLMASPGHRRIILAPEFKRVGIGVVSAGLTGSMFTQEFAG